MQIELDPALEKRLYEVAKYRSIPAAKLVEEVITGFLNSLGDESAAWVRATRQRLPKVWPKEDFSGWAPPRGT